MNRRDVAAGCSSLALSLLGGCASLSPSSRTKTVAPDLEGTAGRETPPDSVVWSDEVARLQFSFVSGDRAVVVQDTDSGQRVIGIGVTSGEVVWEQSFQSDVYLGHGSTVFSLNPGLGDGEERTELRSTETGTLLWEAGEMVRVRAVTDSAVVLSNFADELVTVVGREDWGTVARMDGSLWDVIDGTVVVSRRSDETATLERRTFDGDRQWRRQWDESGLRWITTHTGTGIVTLGERLLGVSLETGETVFETSLGFTFSTNTVSTDRRQYFGGGEINDIGAQNAGIFVLDATDWSIQHHDFPAMSARPVTVADGPVVQLVGDEKRWIAAFSPDFSTRRWRRVGTLVAEGPRGLYVLRGNRLIAVDPDGRRRWRATLDLGVIPASSATGVDYPVRRYGDTVVVTGPDGLASFDATDGTERTRVTGFGEIDTLLPRQSGSKLPDDVVLVGTEERVHAVPV